jgi:hypothetical protein
MTARGTILIGLLLCTALLAVTHIMPARGNSGMCAAIEVETNETGYESAYHAFPRGDGPHAWSVGEGVLVVEDRSGMRVDFSQPMIRGFHCILQTP